MVEWLARHWAPGPYENDPYNGLGQTSSSPQLKQGQNTSWPSSWEGGTNEAKLTKMD